MHSQVLVLVTALVASVAAAPIPNSPLSSVERAEPLVAREAYDAILSPVLDNVKRTLLERLEEIVPVKRSSTEEIEDSETSEKRQIAPISTGTSEKRQGQSMLGDYIDKREPTVFEGASAGSADKRTVFEGASAGSADKRSVFEGASAGSADKRQI